MLDLICFWGTVSIITGVLLTPWIIGLSYVLRHLVTSITEDKELGREIGFKLYNHYDYLYRCSKKGKDAPSPYCSILGKEVHEEIPVVLVLVNVLILIIIAVFMTSPNNYTFIGIIAEVSEYLAPYVGIVVISTGLYTSVILLGRRLFKIVLRVNKVLDKAEAKGNEHS